MEVSLIFKKTNKQTKFGILKSLQLYILEIKQFFMHIIYSEPSNIK